MATTTRFGRSGRTPMVKVFVLGVWDLLHVGHVCVIRYAKSLGDWLCVGVITDDMAESYKCRPTIPERERMEMVLALKWVDEAIYHDSWEANVDFLALNGFTIRAVSPEHAIHDKRQLEVQRRLEAMGMRYVSTMRTPGISSQIIKERIRKET